MTDGWRPHDPSREATVDAHRDVVVDRVAALVRKPVRLRGHVLEVFYADAEEQLCLARKLCEVVQEVLEISGQCVVLMFHTRAESLRLHADFIDNFPHQCHYTVEVNFGGKRKFFCDLCGGAF